MLLAVPVRNMMPLRGLYAVTAPGEPVHAPGLVEQGTTILDPACRVLDAK